MNPLPKFNGSNVLLEVEVEEEIGRGFKTLQSWTPDEGGVDIEHVGGRNEEDSDGTTSLMVVDGGRAWSRS